MENGTPEKPKKIKGYLPLFRREVLLIKHDGFTLAEFAAHIALVLSADWDRKHYKYGCVASNKELEKLTGIDQSSWSRYKKKFLKIGHLLKTPEGNLRFPYYSKYKIEVADKLAKFDIADLQEERAILLQHVAGLQQGIAKLQYLSENTAYDADIKSADISTQTTIQNANVQSDSSPKENINNFREKLEKPNAASQLISPYKIDQDYECNICGKHISGTAADYWYKKTGKGVCYTCSKKLLSKG